MRSTKSSWRLRLRENLNARLIAAVAAVVLLALLAANTAAYLILRDQLDRQSTLALQQGQQTAALVLAERSATLDGLVAVLSQRPTLRRLLAAADFPALASFLEDFRSQSDLDWVIFCDPTQTIHTAAGATLDATLNAALCQSDEPTGYRLLGDRPALLAHAAVVGSSGETAGQVVAGQWIDASFLQTLVEASRLEQSVITSDGQRLISSWPVSAAAPAQPFDAPWPPERHRQQDADGRQYDIIYTALGEGAAPRLWLESAQPVSERLSVERRVLALLMASTAISALVLSGVAAVSVRRANRPLTDALRRSQDAVTAAQSERLAALESLDALIRSIVEGVIMTDAQGTVRFFSAGAERILGLPAAQVLGLPLQHVLLPADGSSFAADALLATPGHGQIIEVRTQAGAVATVMIAATHIDRTAAGGSLHAYLLRDVTEEEAHNRLRSYFLASISHEFRTPLSTLKASLELLVNDDAPLSPSEVGQLLRPAYLSVVGLQTLVDNLLTSSTIEAGRFVLHLTDVDVGLILADAVRVVQPMLERRQQQLIVELPARRGPVRGDAAQLTQVLINFLTNAAKYSPNNATLEVVISQPAAGVLRVAVFDEGPGVAPDARSEIFRRFVRHHENEREQYGVGLGLYVAKSAILAHGGRIDVADRPGGGSEFWFELPVQETPAQRTLREEAA